MNREHALPPRTGALLLPAVFLELGGAVGIWLGLTQESLLLAGAVLGLTAVLGIIWLARDRSARRLQLALNAYAEREIARTEQRRTLKSLNPFSARRQAHDPGNR
jgi:hypothetical protein